jgi:hypothetical protein
VRYFLRGVKLKYYQFGFSRMNCNVFERICVHGNPQNPKQKSLSYKFRHGEKDIIITPDERVYEVSTDEFWVNIILKDLAENHIEYFEQLEKKQYPYKTKIKDGSVYISYNLISSPYSHTITFVFSQDIQIEVAKLTGGLFEYRGLTMDYRNLLQHVVSDLQIQEPDFFEQKTTDLNEVQQTY